MKSFLKTAIIATSVFFILTAAVAINLLVSSGRQIDTACTLDRAVLEASTLAEALKSSNGDLSLAAELLQLENFYLDEKKLMIYYKDDFSVTKADNSAYYAVIKTKRHDLHVIYNIKIFENAALHGKQKAQQDGEQEPLYVLRFKYVRGGGANAE